MTGDPGPGGATKKWAGGRGEPSRSDRSVCVRDRGSARSARHRVLIRERRQPSGTVPDRVVLGVRPRLAPRKRPGIGKRWNNRPGAFKSEGGAGVMAASSIQVRCDAPIGPGVLAFCASAQARSPLMPISDAALSEIARVLRTHVAP